MSIWEHLEYLIGRSLKTLRDQQPFEIMEKTPGDIQLFIYSTRETRRLKRVVLEGAWLQLAREGTITEADIRTRHSTSNYPYVVAILAAMPSVTYSPDSARLTTTMVTDVDS